jgi:hypothetical protein
LTTVAVDRQYSDGSEEQKPTAAASLVGWIMGNVTQWRQIRDNAYKDKWDDYYNTWRGKWVPTSKNKNSERSKLISPGSMSAVDLTVAEIIEAIFAREEFMDIPGSLDPQQKSAAEASRRMLIDDLYADGIIKTMIDVVLNGALYGTGISKINIDVENVHTAKVTQDAQGVARMQRITQEKVKIYPVPVEPGQLVVDPSAANIDDMLGVAHEFRMPLHKVWSRQRSGTYYKSASVGASYLEYSTDMRQEETTGRGQVPAAFITEWHGLVPTKLLTNAVAEGRGHADMVPPGTDELGMDDMTEAVVTIADEGELLRAIPNPAIMDDRAIVAYQHDTVPNRFWGRGVMEKASHPQKAMDAEMRSRIDSLAWVSNPMIAGDITKLPPRMNLNVWPGKFWGTRGDPNVSLKEFRFGDINASTFEHVNSLERMLQDATGARDPANLRQNVRDESSVGGAISVSGMRKLSKRTMYNIEGFLTTLVRRILQRKMQFEPTRYQVDVDFQVRGTMGMVARELEQQVMVNLLQFTEQGTPPYLLLLKAVFDQSSSPVKTEMRQTIDAMLKPDPKAQQQAEMMKQLQMQSVMEEVRNTRADTALKIAQGDKAKADTLLSQIEAHFKEDEQLIENLKVIIDRQEVAVQERQLAQNDRKLDIEEKKAARPAGSA